MVVTPSLEEKGEGAPSRLSGLRVLVVHEWLYVWAGAERCLEQILATFPQADLLVGVITDEMRGHNDVTRRARESWVGRIPGARTRHRWFLPLHALAFALEDTSGYDLIISSSHAFEKVVRARDGAKHVCYCYSPPRFLWGMQATYAEQGGLKSRIALAASGPVLRAVDRRAARRVHRFISISNHIARRVRLAYGVGSDVVYPPVAAKRADAAMRRAPGDPYLLHLGRLVEYKRVDLVVRAAERLQMKLVLAGDGPQRRKLERIAGPHAEFRGDVSELEAADLLTNCAALVFAGEEDFGISLLEANAHGRPVVCYKEGGAAETMIANETAVLFERQDEADVVAGIQRCLDRKWDVAALKRNAERFSPERFRAGLEQVVRSTLAAER